mgnify:CR=1 FL=1
MVSQPLPPEIITLQRVLDEGMHSGGALYAAVSLDEVFEKWVRFPRSLPRSQPPERGSTTGH